MFEKIQYISGEIDKLHPNDPKILQFWDDMTGILSENEQETISFLNALTDPEVILNVSSVFEDISVRLQSRQFIACIEELQRKNQDLPLSGMIKAAKIALDE